MKQLERNSGSFDSERRDEQIEKANGDPKRFFRLKLYEFFMYNFKFFLLVLILAGMYSLYQFLVTQSIGYQYQGEMKNLRFAAVVVVVLSLFLILRQTISIFNIYILKRGQKVQTDVMKNEIKY